MPHLDPLDYDYTVLNLWGLQNDSSKPVVLDKKRICPYLYKEKIPDSERPRILALIKEYQGSNAFGRDRLHPAAPVVTELGARALLTPECLW